MGSYISQLILCLWCGIICMISGLRDMWNKNYTPFYRVASGATSYVVGAFCLHIGSVILIDGILK